MSSLPGKIAVVQASSGARCNASLRGIGRRQLSCRAVPGARLVPGLRFSPKFAALILGIQLASVALLASARNAILRLGKRLSKT